MAHAAAAFLPQRNCTSFLRSSLPHPAGACPHQGLQQDLPLLPSSRLPCPHGLLFRADCAGQIVDGASVRAPLLLGSFSLPALGAPFHPHFPLWTLHLPRPSLHPHGSVRQPCSACGQLQSFHLSALRCSWLQGPESPHSVAPALGDVLSLGLRSPKEATPGNSGTRNNGKTEFRFPIFLLNHPGIRCGLMTGCGSFFPCS